MSELVRFGVAIDDALLVAFDKRVARKGYQNRSEAIRDLIRADLVEDETSAGGEVTASLTLVYDHHVRELTERLTEIQHDLGHHVISTLHVHLDHDHCLEVVVMRGDAGFLREAADRVLATKGVVNGRLTVTGVSPPSHKPSREGSYAHGPDHPHVHGGLHHAHPMHTHGDHQHAPPPRTPRRKARRR